MLVKAVVLLAMLLPCVFPLYFHIKETETKCFIEELPEETMVVGMLVCCYFNPLISSL
jgi:hypothetical protein